MLLGKWKSTPLELDSPTISKYSTKGDLQKDCPRKQSHQKSVMLENVLAISKKRGGVKAMRSDEPKIEWAERGSHTEHGSNFIYPIFARL